MYGSTWVVTREKAEKIKEELIKRGGIEENPKSIYEIWRIRLGNSIFIYYSSNKLYSTPSNEIWRIWELIDSIIKSESDNLKNYLLGFDETGKGEPFGPLVLAGVMVPKEILKNISLEFSTSDTKKKHNYEYWEKLLFSLNSIEDLKYKIDLIMPREIDRFNINMLMDLGYEKLLKNLIYNVPFEDLRIVIDDYGIGNILNKYLQHVKEKGAEVITISDSENKFIEVRVASLIAKAYREKFLKKISEVYKLEEEVIKGNLSDIYVRDRFLQYKKQDFWFLRRSFGEKKIKEKPSFINMIDEEGRVICFFCGKASYQVILDNYKFKCIYCGKEMKDLQFALKYKYGVIKVEDKRIINMILDIFKHKDILDGFDFILPEGSLQDLLPFRDMGKILIDTKSSYLTYIELNLQGDSIVFSLIRNV
uniref:Ribonuclease n=1 Tax=Dictyoglomus thermophilum TaxID=14 RepID=A0A7C3MID6_DICTH